LDIVGFERTTLFNAKQALFSVHPPDLTLMMMDSSLVLDDMS
jgi:hypothetical protein